MADKRKRGQERRDTGHGTVFYDDSKGRWIGQLPRDEFGHRPKVSGASEAEAQSKLYDKLREREQGLLSAGRMTVGQYLNSWVRDTLMLSDRDPRTIEKHERAVRLHLVPVLGKVKLAKLTPMHVQRYVRDELARGKSRNTVQQSLTTLRMALKQAVRWGMLPRNAAALVDGVTPKRPERQPFRADEQRAILEAARSYRLYVVVVLAHATGLRQSELLGLRWSDLDLDGGWLHLRRQLGRDGRLKGLKSEAGQRTLPLPPRVVQVLRVHSAAQDVERRTAVYWEDHDLVTCTVTGRPMSHRNAHRAWTQILKRAGVTHRGIHHMRHTFITTLAENGVHQRVAQQLAGHADSRMTKEVYTHVTDAMMRAAAEAIERATDATVGSPNGSPEGDEPPDDGEGDESEGADLRE